jgi:hypothetical protein
MSGWSFPRSLSLCLLFAGLSACQLERTQPGSVAMGVTRLTAMNAAAVVSAINGDSLCGFLNADVLKSAQVEGTARPAP